MEYKPAVLILNMEETEILRRALKNGDELITDDDWLIMKQARSILGLETERKFRVYNEKSKHRFHKVI